MSDINLATLSLDELKEQARILGISLKGGFSEDTLREKIQAVLDGDSEPAPVKAAPKKKDTVTIVIAESDTDTQPVYVGLNCKSYRIKRGVEVEVPKGVADILAGAKRKVVRNNGEVREVQSYPFQIVG